MPTTARQEKTAAIAAGAVPKPRGKPPKAYPLWDSQRGIWTNEAGDVQPSKKRALETHSDSVAATTAHAASAPPQSPIERAATVSTSEVMHQRTLDQCRGGPNMQRFLRNPWRDEVPSMINTPIVEPVSNWCAHLESMGFSAGGFTATYEEGKWEEQSGRCRRHSV